VGEGEDCGGQAVGEVGKDAVFIAQPVGDLFGAMRAGPIPRAGLPRRNRTFPCSTVPDSAQPSINLSPTNRVNVQ
jgi:hypothetical protein